MKNATLQKFITHGNQEEGSLIAYEQATGVPFTIQRVYTVFCAQENEERGNHAHRILHQLIFSMRGEIVVHCENQWGEKESFVLNHPEVGLYLGPYVWRTLVYEKDAMIMVLASEPYMESDYIRDYDTFIQERKQVNENSL